MPFMDKKLAAFVATLGDDAFLAGRTGKSILRRAMQAELPPDILTRPKSGFRVPVAEWLRGRLRDYARDLLLGPDSRFGAYANRARLTALFDEHEGKVRNREKELWSLLSLEVFLRELSSRSGARAQVLAA
jgi:asparagine synthase (glutamine-hydrolysing)